MFLNSSLLCKQERFCEQLLVKLQHVSLKTAHTNTNITANMRGTCYIWVLGVNCLLSSQPDRPSDPDFVITVGKDLSS